MLNARLETAACSVPAACGGGNNVVLEARRQCSLLDAER